MDRTSLGDAVRRGLARDGGLYVPTGSRRLYAPDAGPTQPSFQDFARACAPALLQGDVAPDTAIQVAERALTFPVPLTEIEPGIFVLELFHGPTLAFKDVGARFMASLMEARTPERDGSETHTTVLVATSGDTGGAVAAAFHGRRGLRVVILFPRQGVSPEQRRQMTTLGGNVTALAVRGTFDDCQRLVKDALATPELAERYGLTSANSINVARLLPQTLYYAYAARLLGRPPHFVVPSGNLGNLCAGLLAHRWGVPAAGFTAACNRNDTFVRFLRTGKTEPRSVVPTLSTAMDVGVPSNLERIRTLYDDQVDRLRNDVEAVTVDDARTRARMRDVYTRTGHILDPHTAVGYDAAHDVRRRLPPDVPVVVLATAHPAKFAGVVREVLGTTPHIPEALAAGASAPEYVQEIEPSLDALVPHLTEHR